jgi:hypothetical protein
MRLRSWIAFIGALVAVGIVAAVWFIVGPGWISAVIAGGIAVLGYIIAAVGARSRSSITGFGEFMRGWLVGLNAGLNTVISFMLLGTLTGTLPALIVGLVLGLLGLLTVFRPVSQSEVYQGLLGYLNWVLPMSWLIVGLGFLFYLVSLLLHAVTLGRVQYLRIRGFAADWKTGTFFMRGGLIANLNPIDTAFNMGNFSFVDMNSSGWHKAHEAGHTLNLAAFGSLFHLVGALDENATPRGANAFSERIAESNDTGASGSNIPMWQ